MNADDLEDIAAEHPNVYRECARAMLAVLHNGITIATQSPASAWGVMFATSHPKCYGRSMLSVAEELGVPRASISTVATRFCKENGLPPSTYMKSEESREISKNAAEKSKNRNKNHE